MRNLPITLIACALVAAALSQCGRPVEPTGGPKDTLSPVVLRTLPSDFSKNMSEKKLEIYFNEYVTIKNLQNEFYASPALEKAPSVRENGKKIRLEFLKPLLPNTTYTLNFGNSIVDVNENNPLRNYAYTFSTGDKLDTAKFNGVVYDSKSMKPYADAFVYFYQNDSLEAPIKYKPDAIAKTDKNGIFIANNLKNTNYKIIAIKDINGNNKLDSGFDEVAFDTTLIYPVNIAAKPDTVPDSLWRASLPPQIKLKMFAETRTRQSFTGSVRPERFKFSLFFNAPDPDIKKLSVNDLSLDDLIMEKDKEGDTLTFWIKNAVTMLSDTLNAEITYMKTDSTGVLVETTETFNLPLPLAKIKKAQLENKENKKKKRDEEEEETPKNPVMRALFDAPEGSVNSEATLRMKVDMPLVDIDTSKITLYLLDEDRNTRKEQAFKIIPTPNDLLSYKIESKWVEDASYQLVADSGAMHNILQYASDSVNYKFNTSNSAKFGIFKLDVKNIVAPTIIEVLDEKGTLVRSQTVRTDGIATFSYIKPGKYSIRLVEDPNDNGKWDTGNYLKQIFPERVAMVVKENETKFELRPGWENEIMLDVKEIFSKN